MITRKITKEGYIALKIGSKWKLEHILVAEKVLNRQLNGFEKIHHVNEIKTDNRPCNLDLFETQNLHQKFHLKKRQFGLTYPIIFEQTYRLIENVAKRESAIKLSSTDEGAVTNIT